MKTSRQNIYLLTIALILVGIGIESSFGQEVEVKSSKVGFHLNNLDDMQPPVIHIITPPIGNLTIYKTDKEDLHIIGEVIDKEAIKFVSVNSEMLVPNEHGYFTTNLKLQLGENSIKFMTIDEEENILIQSLTITYVPPVISLEDRIRRESKYYALIIGIDEYADDGINDLDYPIQDAEKLYSSLTSNYTFSHFNTRLLKNPTRNDIIRELDNLRDVVSPLDNVLIFYAGHGYYDEKGRIGYWWPADASRETTASWFRNSTLVDYLRVIDSKHTLLITDACFAGSIFKARSITMEQDNAYERIYDLRSRKAMTSGSLTEVPDESVFIKYLILRLNENDAKYLSTDELFSRIKMAVTSNSRVVPRYSDIKNVGSEGGDFIFLKRQ